MKRRNGFTLIELLVVTSIVAILTSVVLVSFKGLHSSQEINAARADTISKLREIQNYIINGKILSGETEATDAFIITFTATTKTFRIEYDINGAVSLLEDVKYSQIANNVTLSSLFVNSLPAGTAVVRITAPYGTITVNGSANSNAAVTLSHASGQTKNLVIDGVTGRIAQP